MKENFSTHCRNCDFSLAENAHFCSNCGQRNTDGRITVGELFAHFISNLFNFDGRIFQTLSALAKPGQLTKSFFEGRHVRYYHPVRLFILSGALFIAMLSWTLSEADIGNADSIWDQKKKAYFFKNTYHSLDTLSEQIKTECGDPVASQAIDSLKGRFLTENQTGDLDSVEITNTVNFVPRGTGGSDNVKRKVALDDLMKLSADSLAVKYGVTEFRERMIFVQNIRIQKGLKNFVYYLIGNVLWMILVMMPLLSLALKLLYIRHRFLYVEHLVFSFHTHTVLFVLYSLSFLLLKWADIDIANWMLPLMGGYLLFAIKNFYGQKWGKTILKFILANMLYLGVLVIASTVLMLMSVVFF